jgi:hypothetical protein
LRRRPTLQRANYDSLPASFEAESVFSGISAGRSPELAVLIGELRQLIRLFIQIVREALLFFGVKFARQLFAF